MTNPIKTLILLCLYCLMFSININAEDIITQENGKFIVTLDEDFWGRSEAVKVPPKIVLSANPIKPGNMICYYDGLLDEKYTYTYKEIRKNYLILNKYDQISTDFDSLRPFNNDGKEISIEVENNYKKEFYLIIKGVKIKLSVIKKTDNIIAEPITKKSEFEPFKTLKDFLRS
ncbi:MAG: hypothetical protein PHQ52_04820 [Candidatus Omnitrophica bacterium]|nr:hypothetical protein [Candidatus Omnitrophota bacterium]